MAKDFSIPIIVVAKWPRACEVRYECNGDTRPLLDDFSETALTEKDFDEIMFLYSAFVDVTRFTMPNEKIEIRLI